MKKFLVAVIISAAFSAAINAADAVTITAQDLPAQAAPAKEKGILDAIGNLFAPSKPKETAGAVTPTADTAEKPPENAFALPQKLLITGDLFSTALCAVYWSGFAQSLDSYNRAYNDINNTTFDNYISLKAMREDLINKETYAWISTGAAAAFLLYTAADVLWFHAVFPVTPGLAYRDKIQVLTLNYRF